jgi:hypothetical protein
MCQAGTEVITFEVNKNLGLIFKTTKGCRMQNAIPVTLKGRPIIWFIVEVGAAFAILAARSIGGKALIFDLFKLLASKKHVYSLSDKYVIARNKAISSLK